MIILPALPAIVAAITPLVHAALIAAGIGAVIGGATCAVGGAVSGYREHGELNHEVAIVAVQGVPRCAAEGAIVGGVMAPAGILIGPVVAPALVPVMQVVDDVTRTATQFGDDAIRGAGIAAHSAAMSTEKVVTIALRSVRKGLPPPIQRLLPKSNYHVGFVYVMEDTASGARKIGYSIDPKRRLGNVKSPSGAKAEIVCTIPTYNMKALEGAMHTAYADQRLPNTGAGTEWFDLSSAQVKAICG